MEQIPPEICAEVFRMAHEDGPVHEFYQTSQCPWSFSQVCQRWREITHNSPALWSRIGTQLRAIAVVAPTLASFKLLLMKVLEHSKEHPLEIRLSTGDVDESGRLLEDADSSTAEVMMAFAKTIMETLWPHRSRWLSFASDCNSHYRHNWKAFLDDRSVEQGMPALRRLVIPRLFHGEEYSASMSLFSRLPSLSLLCLNAFPYPGLQTITIDSIQWFNLRNLHLSFFPGSAVPLLIPLLKHLHRVTLLWLCIFGRPPASAQGEPHTLPNIEGLGLDNTLVDWFFCQFTAPRLQALECYYTRSPRTLRSALARSSTALQYLNLYKFQTTVDGTTDLLRALETSPLEHLFLDRVNEDVFLTVLTFLARSRKSSSSDDPDARLPCPQLRSLNLSIDACERPHTVSPPETYLDALTRFFDARALPATDFESSGTSTNSGRAHPNTPNGLRAIRINTGSILDLRSFPRGLRYLEHIRGVTRARDDLDVDVGYQEGSCSISGLRPPHTPVSSLHQDREWTELTPDILAGGVVARLKDLSRTDGASVEGL